MTQDPAGRSPSLVRARERTGRHDDTGGPRPEGHRYLRRRALVQPEQADLGRRRVGVET